ncbi:ECF-type sigma factor [Pseudofulvimonas gallinarii]|uniref:RNA polymerase sigma factor (TIGR02999 family) n=1 Tax=Pseudofulvimonas gallinarii TaxID=634155 RepID=A0A4V2UUP7_9GAMM|nr:ECF-type sigma factor [Pseudofulvimonas gallinarii]TCS92061.1 RNA polymerase sigma factor (TIGR02999 family) [Pseudofulvimonas gallinarii]
MCSETKPEDNVTVLLRRWHDGDRTALERLLPQVYADLRRIAAGQLRRHEGHDTLQTTALVNDVLLRLLDRRLTDFSSTAHLLNAAAQMMRQHLVNRARVAASEKHGGGWLRDEFAQSMSLPIPDDSDIVDLDAALTDLERFDTRMARVVELRYFIGLNVAEIAHALDTSERTVQRDWLLAQAWLRDRFDA